MENDKEKYTESLEYLRARYLGVGTIDYARLEAERSGGRVAKSAPEVKSDDRVQEGSDTPASQSASPVEDNETASVAPPPAAYVPLRTPGIKKTRLEWITDILLLCAGAIVTVTTFFCFASFTTTIGGVTYKDGARNILSFLFGPEDSMLNAFKNAADGLDGAPSVEKLLKDGVSSVMVLYRLIFVSAAALTTIVGIIQFIVAAIVYAAKKDSVKLSLEAINSVIGKLPIYIYFVFFGSVSGGVGINHYYIGYSAGTGMTVGLFLGLALLAAAIVVRFVAFRKTASAGEKTTLLKCAVRGACCTAIAIVLALMKMYPVFMFALSSLLTSLAGIATTGLNFKALVFPVLNIFLFVACLIVLRKVINGFTGTFFKMLTFGVGPNLPGKPTKLNKKLAKLSDMSFLPVAVLGLLSMVSVLLLHNPDIGYGWAVNIYPHVIAIFALSACGQVTLSAVFGEPLKTTKQRKIGFAAY